MTKSTQLQIYDLANAWVATIATNRRLNDLREIEAPMFELRDAVLEHQEAVEVFVELYRAAGEGVHKAFAELSETFKVRHSAP